MNTIVLAPPTDCPTGLDPKAFTEPEAILDAAIGFELHGDRVNRAVMGEGIRDEAADVVGHTVCRGCVMIEDCKQLVERASEETGATLSHPISLRERLDPESVISMWSSSIAVQAQERGYTRESVANMLGTLARSDQAIQGLVIGLLEQDSTHLPVRIGSIKLPSGEYSLVEFDDVRFIVKKNTLDDLGEEKSLQDTFVKLMERDQEGNTLLRDSLQKGALPRRFMTQISSTKRVMEFRPEGSSAKRGFGLLIPKNKNRGIEKDTILLQSVYEAKGGAKATESEAIRVQHSLREVSGEEIEMSIEESTALRSLTPR